MANVTGPQPDVKYCPRCRGDLKNVPRSQVKGYKRKDGTISPYTHTYQCVGCSHRFEINQARWCKFSATQIEDYRQLRAEYAGGARIE